jgi:serine/threonine protein kinase
MVIVQAKGQIEREINIMKLIDHDHCVKLFNIYNSANQVYLVLEMMNGGELFDRIIAKVCTSRFFEIWPRFQLVIFSHRNVTRN